MTTIPENENPPKKSPPRSPLLIGLLLLAILGGVTFIYFQLQYLEIMGEQRPTTLVGNDFSTIPINKNSSATVVKAKKDSLYKKSQMVLSRGAKWMASQFIQLDKTKGGWPHFQWEKKLPGAPTTALALFAMSSLPKKLQKPYEDILGKGANFLIKKMDDQGAVSDKKAYLQYRNYTTAMTLMALIQLNPIKYKKEIAKIQSYLLSSQLNSISKWNWHFGTWNYYETPHLGLRVDISVTAYVLESLKKSGLDYKHKAFQNVKFFLERTQNFRLKQKVKMFDGGFAFHPRNSKAGVISQRGVTIYRSYGSATCDGLRSLIYSGVPLNHKSIKVAKYWLAMNFNAEKNPGFNSLDPLSRGIRYYYYHSLAKAMVASKLYENNLYWSSALTKHLIKLQRKNSSWKNDVNTMSEDNPIIASSFALLTLSTLLDILPEGQINQKKKEAQKKLKVNTQNFPAYTERASRQKKGEQLYNVLNCQACHLLKRRGGTNGPDLTKVGKKYIQAKGSYKKAQLWVINHLRDPEKYPGIDKEKYHIKMPKYAISDEDRLNLAIYLFSVKE